MPGGAAVMDRPDAAATPPPAAAPDDEQSNPEGEPGADTRPV
jgi:hypothetical protein